MGLARCVGAMRPSGAAQDGFSQGPSGAGLVLVSTSGARSATAAGGVRRLLLRG